MSSQNFENALARLESDADYCEQVKANPRQLVEDFGLTAEDLNALYVHAAENGHVPPPTDREKKWSITIHCCMACCSGGGGKPKPGKAAENYEIK